MTDERMALLELIEKQADTDLVREMLAFGAERIMEMEVELRTGVAKGARSALGGRAPVEAHEGLGLKAAA